MGLDPQHPSEYIDFVYIRKTPTDDGFRSKFSLLAVLYSLRLRQDKKGINNNIIIIKSMQVTFSGIQIKDYHKLNCLS
jgi:hypothetical protein